MFGFEIPSGRMWREFDVLLLLLTYALIGYGLITLLGAVLHTRPIYAVRQAQYVGIGSAALFILLFFRGDFFEKGAPLFYALSIALLVYVLTRPEIKGAHSWIVMAGTIRFQPSEPAKIALVLLLARVLAYYSPLEGANLWRGLGAVAGLSLVPFGLIAIQPDLGTAAILIVVVLAMLWAARIQPNMMAAILLWGVLVAVAGYPVLKPHQKSRIVNFLHPDNNPRHGGYHIIQARIAQGSGQIFGKGFGKGTQTELRFLPEYHNDFIYSSLGEQFGFVGSAVAIALFTVFLARAYSRAAKARDLFGAYAIAGLATVIATHVVLNLGMSLGLLPVMGLPLPFFSYGGSFMLTNLMIVGIILNLRMKRHLF